jgi:hypothetical protein
MENSLKLIDGRFEPDQAKIVLSLVANAKIKYHTDKINNSKNMSEENIMHSEKRTVQIQTQLREILEKIEAAKAQGKRVDVESTIKVTIL